MIHCLFPIFFGLSGHHDRYNNLMAMREEMTGQYQYHNLGVNMSNVNKLSSEDMVYKLMCGEEVHKDQ